MTKRDRIEPVKRELRRRMREARSTLDPYVRVSHAEAATCNLLSLPELTAARVVMAYAATAEEIATSRAIDELRALGSTTASSHGFDPTACASGSPTTSSSSTRCPLPSTTNASRWW